MLKGRINKLEIAGNIIIYIGLIFILFGIIGIFKFNNFYAGILVSNKIDTVGFITLIIGLIIKHGLSFFSLKLLLILVIIIVVNPMIAHTVTRSAYLSGYTAQSPTINNKDVNEDIEE